MTEQPEAGRGTTKWPAFVLGVMVGAALALAFVHLARRVNPEKTPTAGVEKSTASPVVDYPLPLNERIRAKIRYYLRPDRTADLLESYQRSGEYLPMISAALEEYDLPRFLTYLPIIESRFLPGVRSPSGAAGLWQIMPRTAVEYGLKRNRWIDERRDPEKSTIVAAKYLRWLFDKFGDWDMVLAAYNCGVTKTVRAMRREHTSSFWRLRTLPRETRHFVPKFYAVLHILANPGEYGIALPPRHPAMNFETVELQAALPIGTISELAHVSPSLIKSLNPALIAEVAPGGKYPIRLPVGAKNRFLQQIEQIPSERLKTAYTTYRVKEGDTLAEIAKTFGTTVSAIRRDNHLRNPRWIDVGMELKITRASMIDNGGMKIDRGPVSGAKEERIQLNYKSERNDLPLNTIARYYGVPMAQIRSWNPWLKQDRLRKGEEVVIYKSRDELTLHRTRRGDSLWLLAKKYRTSVSCLKTWNQLRTSLIHPGDRLIVGMR